MVFRPSTVPVVPSSTKSMAPVSAWNENDVKAPALTPLNGDRTCVTRSNCHNHDDEELTETATYGLHKSRFGEPGGETM